METITAEHKVNQTVRTFTMTEGPCGPNLKAELLRRGFDGKVWAGYAPAEGKRKARHAIFYRAAKTGVFQFITGY